LKLPLVVDCDTQDRNNGFKGSNYAGHRALERILPKQYVPIWQRLAELAEAHKAAHAEASNRSRAAKERERKAKQRELHEVLNKTGVIMASDKLEMVQTLLEMAKKEVEMSKVLGSEASQERKGLSEAVARKLQNNFGVCDAHVKMAAAHMHAGAAPDASFCASAFKGGRDGVSHAQRFSSFGQTRFKKYALGCISVKGAIV
jgi:hypothetical protein